MERKLGGVYLDNFDPNSRLTNYFCAVDGSSSDWFDDRHSGDTDGFRCFMNFLVMFSRKRKEPSEALHLLLCFEGQRSINYDHSAPTWFNPQPLTDDGNVRESSSSSYPDNQLLLNCLPFEDDKGNANVGCVLRYAQQWWFRYEISSSEQI